MTNPTQDIPEWYEEWISQWLFENVVSDGENHKYHVTKTVWARAIALAAYNEIRARQPVQLGNPTQEAIPVEELKRMKQDASSACNTIDWLNFPEDLYLEAAKAEFIRARQQAQRETPPRWVKASERLPDDHITHAARFIGTSGYEYTSLTIEDMDVFIGEESHYMIRNFPKGLLKSLEWLEEVSAQAQYTSDSPEAEDGGDSLEEGLQLARDAGMSQSDWDKQTKKSLTEDIPVPEEMEKYIISRLNQYTWSGKTYKNAYSSMVAMYRHLIEAAQKQPETMGKEPGSWKTQTN